METMGVNGIWGLERLERTGISSARCGLILIGVLVAFNYVLLGLTSGFGGALVFGSIEGLGLLAALALSRATQADLERFLPSDDGVSASIHLLKPTKRSLLVWFFLALTGFWTTTAYALASLSGVEFTEFHQEWVLGGPGQMVFWYAAGPFYSLCLAVMLAVVVTQARALSHAVRRIDIDILRLDRYPHLANPLIRIVSFLLILLSIFPVLSVMTEDRGADRIALVSMPLLAFFALTLTALYAYPIWLLKGRIRGAKEGELRRVLTALGGDDGAMAESRIRDRASGLTISELLDYRTFIESLWDWPVAPHIQRVVLFGLLPPLTWVLAGMVENAVGVIVGLN